MAAGQGTRMNSDLPKVLHEVGGRDSDWALGPDQLWFAEAFPEGAALWGDASLSKGWGIPTATDIALAWLVARAVFGKGHPAIDFLLLTHAHLDHCGRLPLLVKRGFRGPIYAQEATCELTAILLADENG